MGSDPTVHVTATLELQNTTVCCSNGSTAVTATLVLVYIVYSAIWI